MLAYRICERKNGKLYTLFHKIIESREMPMNQWLKAEIKDVCDGDKKRSKVYKSGFHVLPTLEECRKFTKKFYAPRDLVIVKCDTTGAFWRKEHSKSNVLLVENIKLLEIIEKVNLKLWNNKKKK